MNTPSVVKSLARLALVAFAAIPACGGRTADPGDAGSSSGGSGGGGGGSGGGFPYSGPSCSSNTIPQGCWSCIENSCPSLGSCITSACSGYFNCYCACNPGDTNCMQGCQSMMSPACDSCVASAGQCVVTGCEQACTSTIMMGGSGSSSGGGGFGSSTGGGSSGGTSTELDCAASNMPCANDQTVQLCTTLTNGVCTAAYYQITFGDNDGGSEEIDCASCTDTTACLQQVTAACQ